MPTSGTPPLSGDSEVRDSQRIRRAVDIYLTTHAPIPGLDRDDLYQEGCLAWLLAADTYRLEGGASRATYIGHIVENRLRSLARAGRAQKRGAGSHALSLDAPVTEEGDSLAEVIADVAPLPHELAEGSDSIAHLARLRARLPERERRVLDALAADLPRAAIARDLGIHRDTLYEDIRRIRAVARDEGLEDFLR